MFGKAFNAVQNHLCIRVSSEKHLEGKPLGLPLTVECPELKVQSKDSKLILCWLTVDWGILICGQNLSESHPMKKQAMNRNNSSIGSCKKKMQYILDVIVFILRRQPTLT